MVVIDKNIFTHASVVPHDHANIYILQTLIPVRATLVKMVACVKMLRAAGPVPVLHVNRVSYRLIGNATSLHISCMSFISL